MKRLLLVLCFTCCSEFAVAAVGELRPSVEPMIREFCVRCHDAEAASGLNLEQLKYDLSDGRTFRQWVKVYDQVSAGKMPPPSEPLVAATQRDAALEAMKKHLRAKSLAVQQERGRVPARRLTRLEYDFTVRDLLQIDGQFADLLLEESDAGSFDTVGSEQRISALHLESYLIAADRAIDAAIRLHKNPYRKYKFDLLNNEHLNSFHERELRIGGNISRKLDDDGVVLFRDVDYLLRSDLHGFRVKSYGSGVYRIRVDAQAFQSQSPVAMKVVLKDISGETELVGAFDLMPGESRSVEVKAHLTKTKVFYVSMAEERSPALILADLYDAGGARKYKGRGVLINSIRVEGPLTGGWPPQSTRDIFGKSLTAGEPGGGFAVRASSEPLSDVEKMIAPIARRAFRRTLTDVELQAFVQLAKPALDEDADLATAIRSPLRAILSSPQFLMLTGKPGRLGDSALAARLSCFLWKTLPDEELLMLAERRELSDPAILRRQVERLLSDVRSRRFVSDFSGQWLRLNEIDATTPDEKLYPEYDEILHSSIVQETPLFLNELIEKDLGVGQLIDSEFTFLNRRLAEHYEIDGVTGQQLRRVNLPKKGPRGGLLTQASILKVTANGLVTSPVKRGAFVLADLMGTPLPPPPKDVGSIEPDTAGATDIREVLQRHREDVSCAKCHDAIDPPGFALECFDPIGGFRTHYRKRFDDILAFLQYEDGPPVDSRGVTAEGEEFRDIRQFKARLLEQREQLARHLISQLVVYSTGGEIQFADRDEIEAILATTRDAGFPLRTIIHAVVQSEIFRNR